MDEIQICDFIKVLVDCPSNHNDGFLAILNMKTKGYMKTKSNRYRFYKKPMSNRMTIMASSALPPNVKWATMTNEVLWRLRTGVSTRAPGPRLSRPPW